jgi:hypothetical protein
MSEIEKRAGTPPAADRDSSPKRPDTLDAGAIDNALAGRGYYSLSEGTNVGIAFHVRNKWSRWYRDDVPAVVMSLAQPQEVTSVGSIRGTDGPSFIAFSLSSTDLRVANSELDVAMADETAGGDGDDISGINQKIRVESGRARGSFFEKNPQVLGVLTARGIGEDEVDDMDLIVNVTGVEPQGSSADPAAGESLVWFLNTDERAIKFPNPRDLIGKANFFAESTLDPLIDRLQESSPLTAEGIAVACAPLEKGRLEELVDLEQLSEMQAGMFAGKDDDLEEVMIEVSQVGYNRWGENTQGYNGLANAQRHGESGSLEIMLRPDNAPGITSANRRRIKYVWGEEKPGDGEVKTLEVFDSNRYMDDSYLQKDRRRTDRVLRVSFRPGEYLLNASTRLETVESTSANVHVYDDPATGRVTSAEISVSTDLPKSSKSVIV